MFNSRRSHISFLVSAVAVILVINFLVAHIYYGHNFVPGAQAQITSTQRAADENSLPLSLPDLFSKVQNSVVQVSDVVRTINGLGSRLGSGFVYDNEGHIIT